MHVLPYYRGLGIARMIAQFLLESKKTGSTVYCLPFAHLQGFYESEGFKEVSKEDFLKSLKKLWKNTVGVIGPILIECFF